MTTPMTPEERPLVALVARVARLRQEYHGLKDHVAALEASFRQDHADRLNALDAAKLELNVAESALREAAEDEFARTGLKAVAPGVLVKEVTRLVYAPEDALEWAKSTGLCLKLDVSAFEKVAKAAQPPFVTFRSVPTATVAADLDTPLMESTQNG